MYVDDARVVGLRRALEARPAAASERVANTLEAAVALLVRPREQLELLLIKRAIHDRDPWSGHVALPGGRRDHNDADLIETAMRETDEEVGIMLPKVGVLVGTLDEVVPGTTRLPPILIAPFVFAVPTTTAATINEREVDAAIWVPLAALRDQRAASEILIELEGGARTFPSLIFGEYVIWGLTHRILTQVLDITVGLT